VNRLVVTNNYSYQSGGIIPLIKMRDVPITKAIESLARQADINYIITPNLYSTTDSDGDGVQEPTVNLNVQNDTALNVLNRIFSQHNLIMTEDPVTTVERITRSDETLNVVDASLLEMNTNIPTLHTNIVIPLIQFQDVPLDVGLEALIQQCEIKIELNPRINGASLTGKYFDPMPTISMSWKNITAKQSLLALCQNYDLIFVKDDATGVIEIEPRTAKKHHHTHH
jgi:hypothetical protein